MLTSRLIRRRLRTHPIRSFLRLSTLNFSRSRTFSTLSSSEHQHYWDERKKHKYGTFRFFLYGLPFAGAGPFLLALVAYFKEEKMKEVTTVFSYDQLEAAAEWWTNEVKKIHGQKIPKCYLEKFQALLIEKMCLLTVKNAPNSQKQTKYLEVSCYTVYEAIKESGIESLPNHAVLNPYLSLLLSYQNMHVYSNGYTTLGNKIILTSDSAVCSDLTPFLNKFDTQDDVTILFSPFRLVPVNDSYAKITLDNFLDSESAFLNLSDEELTKILANPVLSKKYIRNIKEITYHGHLHWLLGQHYPSDTFGISTIKKSNKHPGYYCHETTIPLKIMRAPGSINAVIFSSNENHPIELEEGALIIQRDTENNRKNFSVISPSNKKGLKVLDSQGKEIKNIRLLSMCLNSAPTPSQSFTKKL